MSVVGIDFGNLQSVIAVARNRGIDVITNEVSNRATPALVSFSPRQRFLGESAKTQEVANFKNTVGSLVRLIGRRWDEPEVQEIEARYVNAPLCADPAGSGEVAVKVLYLGEEKVFTATQVVAMYLGKLRDTAAKELTSAVSDVVISVPSWFTDRQRRAMMDAAQIAGLNCLRLMNDITASALAYGITKTDLPEEKPRHVVLVDVGHAHYSCAIVAYRKGELKIKSANCDRHFGGRNFDELLVDHFAKLIQEKHKMDVKSNSKALLRLRVGCEKLKKILSANPQAPLNIESIMNDKDISYVMKRAEFEELISHITSRVEDPLQKLLADAELTVDDIDSVELIGGSTRIPAIKERLSQFFNKELSTTLNQDEAVSRGCALQCAILSPAFRVREFSIADISLYPIKFSWQPAKTDAAAEDTNVEVFCRNNIVPCTKILTFYRSEPFEVDAAYADPESLPKGMSPVIGKYTITKVKPIGDEENATVKLKARLNGNGIVGVENAYIVEEILREEEVPVEGDTSVPPKTEKKVKKVTKKHELPVVASIATLDVAGVAGLTELEGQMRVSDKLVTDTEERKNALEEYVYELRDKLDMHYSEFVVDSDAEQIKQKLRETEDWLYDEGEDTTKSVYITKLDELKKLGEPIAERARNWEELPKAEQALRETCNQYRTQASSSDERFEHISEEDREKVKTECRRVFNWVDSKMGEALAIPKTEKPVLFASEVRSEREKLVLLCSVIMSKPKPKVAPPQPETKPQSDASMDPEPTAQTEDKDETKKTPDMDID